MIFYVFLVLVILGLFFLSYRYPSLEKNISFILFGIIVLIGGFRDRIGGDYDSYVNWYLSGNRDSDFEFGFLAIMKFFRYFNLDYHFLFFFFSFFTYLFIYLGIRKYAESSILSLVLFFLIPVVFFNSFSAIRQFFSLAIAFYAFSYLLDKKYFVYVLLMAIGVSIHKTCLIPFVVFLIIFKWGEFVRVRHLCALIGITFIIGQIGIIHWLSFLLKDSHYYYYVSSQFSVRVPLINLLVKNIFFLLVISYYWICGFKYSNQKYLLLVYVCSILFLNLFSESINLMRVSFYFIVFEIIVVGEIIRDSIVKKRYYLIACISCFYLFLYFRAIRIDYETVPESLRLIPYKSLLFIVR
jgi:hypothetical protein